MKRSFSRLLTAALIVVAAMTTASAGPWVKDGPMEARLIAAVTAAGDITAVPMALEVRLEPGWKTYWRTPGDAGLPPGFDWSRSENLKEAVHGYPPPHRFSTLGIETIGYDSEVTFPITATLAEPGRALALRATVDLLVCADICVPHRVAVSHDLPAGPADASGDANAVARAAASVPGDGVAAGLTVTAVRASGATLEVEVTGREPFAAPDLFVETTPRVAFAAPRVTFHDDDRRVVMRVAPFETAEAPDLTGLPLTLTLVDGARAAEIRTTPVAAAAAGNGLAAMLGVALLGGLVLNLMPCVLPVLSLKLLSIAEQGGRAPAAVRAGFLASAAGILASFLVLALAMATLKAGGAAVGWGIQFQHPWFLVFMVTLVTLFAANLWGLFEVPLPRALADALGGGEGKGLGGQFATGAAATLLATPCSAPFLGTAVGFALAGGPLEIFSVFGALGIGMALPYLAVAALPQAASALPRPGRWMVRLRQLLGVALALTAAWLLSVLAVQAGEAAAGLVAALMVAVVIALWVSRRFARRAGAAAAAVLALVAFVVPAVSRPRVESEVATGRWVAFDEAAIRDHVAAGRTVFVDVTADWCITCLANKKLVLSRGDVGKRLEGPGVIAMKADWTRPNEAIARYLARNGRYGIPFNMVYGPATPTGIALPELLTDTAVLDALARAGLPAGAPGG